MEIRNIYIFEIEDECDIICVAILKSIYDNAN